MTAAEIYNSVTSGGASDLAEDELDPIRIGEVYPELHELLLKEIAEQLE
jgi:hypothetical protein